MLTTAAIVAAAAGLVIVGVLAVPLRLTVRAALTDRLLADWRVLWLYGLVDVRVDQARRSDETRAGRAPDRPPASQREARPPRAGRPRRRILAVLRTRGLLARVMRLPVDLLRRCHWDALDGEVAYGFDYPADTGIVYGCLAPLLTAAAASGLALRCTPDFARAGFTGHCAAALRVRPLAILGVVAAFLVSRPVWRAVWVWRAAR
jgi:hypothetical protein